MSYAWEQVEGGRSFVMKIGNWLAHSYVEKHTKDEIFADEPSKIAGMMYDAMYMEGRKYLEKGCDWTPHCVIQEKAQKIAGGKERLLEQYEAFICEKMYKNLDKYKDITEEEVREKRPEYVEAAMVFNPRTRTKEHAFTGL